MHRLLCALTAQASSDRSFRHVEPHNLVRVHNLDLVLAAATLAMGMPCRDMSLSCLAAGRSRSYAILS